MNPKIILFLLNTIISLAINPAFGDSFSTSEHPTYRDGILTIPLVDTPEQTGNFQDVTLRLTEQGEWQLLGFKMLDTYPLVKPHVYAVEIIVTETFPTQVFLKVDGVLINLCTKMEKISQRLEGNRFEITISAENLLPPVGYTCPQQSVDFEEVIPLPVYGLKAGIYEYSLGDVFSFGVGGPSVKTFTGTFELTRDNILPSGTN